MKKTFITILACLMAILALTLTGCGNHEKQNKDEEIKQAVSAAVDFLNTVKDSGNYSSVSEYSDGSIYTYYTEDGKIKVEYKNDVFYGVEVGNSLYKIIQTDDMIWHKTNDTADLYDSITRTNNLINGINNTSNLSLWTDYDSKTKTLTATYSDGSATLKLDAGLFVITYNTNSGTVKHIIKEVNNTTVTLPENIIDDTQIIPNSVSFGVRYVKSTVGAEENSQIVKSVSQLNDYIATEQQNIGLPIVLFKDEIVSKYNDEYFENSFIVIFMKEARSGSFDFRVNDVQANGDRLIINYEIVLPEGYGEDVGVTCDMAYWYSFVELSNEYSSVNKVDLISLKQANEV